MGLVGRGQQGNVAVCSNTVRTYFPTDPRALEPFGKYALKKTQTSPHVVLITALLLPVGQSSRGRPPRHCGGRGWEGKVSVRSMQRKSQQEISGPPFS